MKKTPVLKSLPFRLFSSMAIGCCLGLLLRLKDGSALSSMALNLAVTIKSVLGQLINFCVPLIIFGFLAPALARMKKNSSHIRAAAVGMAYLSSLGAALFAMTAGYLIIPGFPFSALGEQIRFLPDAVFRLSIPQIMPVRSAITLSILTGLTAAKAKAQTVTDLLEEFKKMARTLILSFLVPLLPPYTAVTFCSLAYKGALKNQLPILLKMLLLVILGHGIWLAFLYALAGIYARSNPLKVLKSHGAAYLTAIKTMSPSKSLKVLAQCADKSPSQQKEASVLELFGHIHLCGSVLTEVFFVMAISRLIYGSIPSMGSMLLFCILLGLFAIAAPGTPGGTLLVSLGLITGLLKFGDGGTSLILVLSALQDGFATACSVAGNGALALILKTFAKRRGLSLKPLEEERSS